MADTKIYIKTYFIKKKKKETNHWCTKQLTCINKLFIFMFINWTIILSEHETPFSHMFQYFFIT